MNPFHVVLHSNSGTIQPYIFLRSSDVTPESIYWTQVFKSSEWPEITTAKDYFILYGTVHANAEDGGIYWGQCDTPKGVGFVESGLIMQGDQAETPYLIKANGKIHLYHHVHTPNTRNGYTIQETRLWSTTGGELHNTTWTDEGFPLGLEATEDHTGYARFFRKPDNTIVALHLIKQAGSGEAWVSYSTDEGLNFTRQYQIDTTQAMPTGGTFGYSVICPFKYNNIQYGFFQYIDPTAKTHIAIAKLDADFLPLEFVKSIYQFDNLSDVQLYLDGNTAYINIKDTVEIGGVYKQFVYNIADI